MDSDTLKKQIGQKIKQFRAIKGWTRQQAADLLEVSLTAYGSIERGETDVNITRLGQIAEIFEVTLADLLGLTEKTVFNFTRTQTHNTAECLIVAGISNNTNDSELKHELDKSNILLKERDKEIEHLKEQNSQLKEIIALMKMTSNQQE